ncbi:MAG: hypothetical protein BroJett003_17750 [Planctomycetota bacterium]|nr:MAG: hypothetical protein BroJett003_17750 [Planctomycetota bacterium]
MTRRTIPLLAALATLTGCSQTDDSIATQKKGGWQRLDPAALADAVESPPPKILPQTHFAAGQLLEAQGDFNRAIAQYQRAVLLNHNFVAAYHRLGMVLARQGRHREAIDNLEKAVALRPHEPILRNNLGFEYCRINDFDRAVTHLQAAVAIDPQFERAQVNLGMALSKVGRFDEALEAFRAVLPESHAQYNLGMMFCGAKRYRDAGLAFHRALQLDPALTAARTQLASIEAYVDVSSFETPQPASDDDSNPSPWEIQTLTGAPEAQTQDSPSRLEPLQKLDDDVNPAPSDETAEYVADDLELISSPIVDESDDACDDSVADASDDTGGFASSETDSGSHASTETGEGQRDHDDPSGAQHTEADATSDVPEISDPIPPADEDCEDDGEPHVRFEDVFPVDDDLTPSMPYQDALRAPAFAFSVPVMEQPVETWVRTVEARAEYVPVEVETFVAREPTWWTEATAGSTPCADETPFFTDPDPVLPADDDETAFFMTDPEAALFEDAEPATEKTPPSAPPMFGTPLNPEATLNEPIVTVQPSIDAEPFPLALPTTEPVVFWSELGFGWIRISEEHGLADEPAAWPSSLLGSVELADPAAEASTWSPDEASDGDERCDDGELIEHWSSDDFRFGSILMLAEPGAEAAPARGTMSDRPERTARITYPRPWP